MGGGRAPCCDKNTVKRGPWSPVEDLRLAAFIQKNGHGNWRSLPKQAGLLRCGKSCRLRWINYLSPNVKRGNFTLQEEEAIIKLHDSYGNKWSKIAAELPGRTDNEIKNVWNTHLKKRLQGKGFKCHKNNIVKPSSASPSSSSATSHTCSGDQFPSAKMSESLTEIPTQNCPNNAKKETSRSSSFSSNTSNFSTSTTRVSDHDAKPSEEMESLLSYSEEAPDNYLEELDKIDIMDSDFDFDVWNVLEDFEKFEAQQEQQLVTSHLQGSNFGDENYIINHDIELAEKSEWYKYLENNEIGLVGIIGEVDQNISQNKKTENEMSLEPEIDPDMNCFQYCWPPSPHNF